MSNELVNWQERLAEEAKEVAALERPAITQISTRGGQMMYQKVPVPGNRMTVIIVASAFENKYFSKAFDPNQYEAPDCYALSLTGNDMAPHEDAKEKKSDVCLTCEFNKWGSAGQNRKGKACKEVRRLALLPSAILNNGTPGSGELAVLSVPVTSIKNWANYVNAIASEFSRPPWAVLTEIRTEPDARTQFQIKFEFKGLVPDESLGTVSGRVETAQRVLLTPYDESGTVAQAPDPMPNRKY